MKKLVMLLVIVWRISVYSGDTGCITFTVATPPRFSHEGRWVHFIDRDGEKIDISVGSTIIIRRTEE